MFIKFSLEARSHTFAKQAAEDGNLTDVIPEKTPKIKDYISADNGIEFSSRHRWLN